MLAHRNPYSMPLIMGLCFTVRVLGNARSNTAETLAIFYVSRQVLQFQASLFRFFLRTTYTFSKLHEEGLDAPASLITCHLHENTIMPNWLYSLRKTVCTGDQCYM